MISKMRSPASGSVLIRYSVRTIFLCSNDRICRCDSEAAAWVHGYNYSESGSRNCVWKCDFRGGDDCGVEFAESAYGIAESVGGECEVFELKLIGLMISRRLWWDMSTEGRRNHRIHEGFRLAIFGFQARSR